MTVGFVCLNRKQCDEKPPPFIPFSQRTIASSDYVGLLWRDVKSVDTYHTFLIVHPCFHLGDPIVPLETPPQRLSHIAAVEFSHARSALFLVWGLSHIKRTCPSNSAAAVSAGLVFFLLVCVCVCGFHLPQLHLKDGLNQTLESIPSKPAGGMFKSARRHRQG